MARITSSSSHFAEKYGGGYGKDRLIFEIEMKAFQWILPHLPKPWLALGMGSGRLAWVFDILGEMGKERNLLKMSRTRKVPVILTLCRASSPILFLKECHHLLKHEGKVLIGFIPRDSPWGRFYLRKKACHSIQRLAQLYPLKKVEHMMMGAGFSIEGYFSTLFQKPGAVKDLEKPMAGYHPQAGFLVIIGERRTW